MNGIEVKNVTKTFGDKDALRDVNLALDAGKIYGLLGRNGAGKSTLLNIIANRISATSGAVELSGESVWENAAAQRQIYLMSEQTLYPASMKIRDVFKWSAAFYPGFDMDYALLISEKFKLPLGKPVRSLSTGYNSIMKLIVALSCNAPYVLLDEPVLGLDANHRELFYTLLIEKYAANPFTVVLSTHLIEEAASLLEEVIIVKDGQIIRKESCEKLLASGYTVSGAAAQVDAFCAGKQVIGTDSLGGLKTAYILGLHPTEGAETLTISPLDLQRLFIRLTND